MNFRKAENVLPGGTHLQGEVDVAYSRLVEVFGPPHFAGDGDKTQAEWCLQFEDGTLATVYDYKNRLAPARIRNWHVGGFENLALEHVKSALGI